MKIGDLLNTLPTWSILILLLGIVILIFLLLKKRNFLIRTKNIEISTNSENIYLVINKSIMVADEISEIKYRRRLNEQMSFCDDAIEAIRSIILNHFRDLLEEKKVTNLIASKEYKIYEKIIYILLDQMRSLCKKRFEEMYDIFDKKENVNNTFDFIKLEFNQYKDRITLNIMQRASSIITNEWVDSPLLTREDTEEHSQDILPEIQSKVESVFQNAIEVQLKYSKRINELDLEIKNFIKSLGEKGNKIK